MYQANNMSEYEDMGTYKPFDVDQVKEIIKMFN
jgi:hypothetical protein